MLALAACSNDVTVGDKPNVEPAVSISGPSDGSVFSELDTIELTGIISDGNGRDDIQTHSWTSDLQGLLAENGDPLQVVQDLGFARCRLSLAVERSRTWKGLNDLDGGVIATSHPEILADFLDRNGIRARIRRIAGSVEIAPAIGVADAVCDLVSSGSTLLSNGLREVETVFESSAQLVASPGLGGGQAALLDRLLLRIRAVLRARTHKYILLNAPEDSLKPICGLLPGMKSPTISRLNQPGWISVQSVVPEEAFWGVVDRLHALGAEGILVLGLEKMVF